MTTNWTAKTPKVFLNWASFFTLLWGSSVAAQTDVEFRLSCKVKDSIVMAAEEGRPKRYTHFTDEFVVGDTLNLLVNLQTNDTLWLKLEDPLRDEVLVAALHPVENIRYWDTDMDYLNNDKDVRGRFGIATNDSIMIENSFPEHSEIYLERYYKDDWQGLFKKGSHLTTQVAIFDCRVSGRSNLAEITERLKSRVKKWDE
jgi:hypothetical protein